MAVLCVGAGVDGALLGDEQHRHLGRLGRELPLHVASGEEAGQFAERQLVDHVGDRHRVEAGGVGMEVGARRVGDACGNIGDERIEPVQIISESGIDRVHVVRPEQATVAVQPPPDRCPRRGDGVERQTEPRDQLDDAGVHGVDPLRSRFGVLPLGELVMAGERTTTDAFGRLEDDDLDASGAEAVRGREPGQTRADDDDTHRGLSPRRALRRSATTSRLTASAPRRRTRARPPSRRTGPLRRRRRTV